MNREIKFRAWSKSSKNMLENPAITDGSDGGPTSYVDLNTGLIDDDLIFMQYTGLKDKNGKEIYEGDILMHVGTNQCDLEIHFKDGAFWGKGIFTDCVMDRYLKSYDFQSIEVIGNIYENPELLTQSTL